MNLEKKTEPPPWFTRAVQAPYEDRFIEVEGCRIHYLRRGQPGRRGLLFVHGGYAHAHWWDFIAPFFADQCCVAALDLSGMGKSGYRKSYSGETYAHEAIAVCADAGFAPRPVIVGHSFGGFVALKAAALYGNDLTGAIVADFPFRPPDLQQEHDARQRQRQAKRIYSSLEEALARFRLIPAQPCENDFILEYIARHSLTKIDGGWSWKFDDHLFDGFQLGNIVQELAKVTCRLAVVFGEHSALFPPEIAEYVRHLVRDRSPVITIPGAYHHLFLDQPLAFIEVLRSLLAQWCGLKPAELAAADA